MKKRNYKINNHRLHRFSRIFLSFNSSNPWLPLKLPSRKIAWLFIFLIALVFAFHPVSAETQARKKAPKTLTLDFKDADVRDILRAIGTQFRINIVIDQNVSGKITVHLDNVPLLDGLRMLLESNGFTFEKKGEIYYVKKLEKDRFMNIQATATTLTIDVRNKDIHEVLREISNQSGINIVADQSVRGDITGLLHDVPLEIGLSSLLSANGYLLRKKAGIYQVTKAAGEAGRRKMLAITVQEIEPSPPDTTKSSVTPPLPGGLTPNGRGMKEGRYSVTMDVSDADLGSVMDEIASQTKMNIVTYGDLRGTVNAKIEKMPLENALNLIFQGTNYTYKKISDETKTTCVYLVGEKSPGSPAAQALTSSQLIKLQHIKADGIPALLPPSISQANIKVIKEQNALLMTGTEDQIEQLREFIGQIDIVSPQIMIEALIVELSKRATREIGFRGGYFKADSASLHFPKVSVSADADQLNKALDDLASHFKFGTLGKLPENFMVTLEALETAGKAKVRARPRIATLNGNPANINVGWVRYYQTTSQTPQGTITQIHSIDAGISLKIVPWVSASGEITTEISPQVSNLSGIGAGGLPEISRRTAETTIRLKDGETIIIGGLIQKTSASSREKIPILGDIPFLGYLFSKTSTTSDESELVIYITPHILEGGE